VGHPLTASPVKDTNEKSRKVELMYEVVSGWTEGLGKARRVITLDNIMRDIIRSE
jgi:hypothetical protein